MDQFLNVINIVKLLPKTTIEESEERVEDYMRVCHRVYYDEELIGQYVLCYEDRSQPTLRSHTFGYYGESIFTDDYRATTQTYKLASILLEKIVKKVSKRIRRDLEKLDKVAQIFKEIST